MSRKTRFVCISDTHNTIPANGAFKLPKGDVLIHAGDLTNQGTYSEIRKTLDWIEAADFESKIIIAGNHDITLDKRFYAEFGLYFHNQYPQNSQACIELFKSYPSITYLNHESATIRLSKDGGPRTRFKVFGSPFSPANGLWAFGYLPEEASKLWEQIPLDTDIFVTHTPPKYHCDESKGRGAAGCETLRQKLWQIRPRLAVCGHVHEGRGAERVLWDLESPHIQYKELEIKYWTDPGHGNKEQSLINLSAKKTKPAKNTSNFEAGAPGTEVETFSGGPSQTPFGCWTSRDFITNPNQPFSDPQVPATSGPVEFAKPSTDYRDIEGGATFKRSFSFVPLDTKKSTSSTSRESSLATSADFDTDALVAGKETCIINAAIMASSRHRGTKQVKGFHKAIVVDLDLPVC